MSCKFDNLVSDPKFREDNTVRMKYYIPHIFSFREKGERQIQFPCLARK